MYLELPYDARFNNYRVGWKIRSLRRSSHPLTHTLSGRFDSAKVDIFHAGRRKFCERTVLCIYTLHKTYPLKISPNIRAFNEWAAATPELAYTASLLGNAESFFVGTGPPIRFLCCHSEEVDRNALLLTKKEGLRINRSD